MFPKQETKPSASFSFTQKQHDFFPVPFFMVTETRAHLSPSVPIPPSLTGGCLKQVWVSGPRNLDLVIRSPGIKNTCIHAGNPHVGGHRRELSQKQHTIDLGP